MSDATGFEEVVASADGVNTEMEFRTTVDSEPPSIRDVGDRGWGTDLKTPAWEEVRDRLDPHDYADGTRVATIHYDLDAWTVDVEYHADTLLAERARDVVRAALGI